MESLRCARNDVLHALMYLPHCSCDQELTSGKEPASLTWPESAHSKATSGKGDGLSKLDGYTAPNKGKTLLINEQKLSKYPNKNNKVQVQIPFDFWPNLLHTPTVESYSLLSKKTRTF